MRDIETARELAGIWTRGEVTGDVRTDMAAYQAAVYTDPQVQEALSVILRRAVVLAGPGDEDHGWAVAAVAQVGTSLAAETAMLDYAATAALYQADRDAQATRR